MLWRDAFGMCLNVFLHDDRKVSMMELVFVVKAGMFSEPWFLPASAKEY